MSTCILSTKTGDSNVTLLKDGLTINLPYEKAAHGYSLAKESSGSLVDAYVSVHYFSALLRTQGDPVCHAKERKSLGR